MNLILTLLIFSCIALMFWVLRLRLEIRSQSTPEQLLVESEHRFQSLLESIPNISVQGYDRDRRVIFWNEASEELYGYSRQEAVGQRLEDLIIPDEMKKFVIEATHNAMSTGANIPAAELTLRTKSGAPIDVYSSHVMQFDRNGQPEMYCLDIDLTVHRNDEIAIQQGEQRALAIIKASPIPFALHNSNMTPTFLNNAFTNLFGYDLVDIPDLEAWENKAYPDKEYSKEVKLTWLKYFEDYIKDGAHFEPLEITICCKNGEFKTVMAQASTLSNSAEGEVLISFYDISERKKLEEQQLLSATIFQHTSEGILATDSERIITVVNPAFFELTGYSENEVVGQYSHILMSNRHDADFYADMNKELERTGKWQGEVWHNRKNSEQFLVWLTINTIYNEDGSVKNHLALFSDITEKKQAELLAIKQANYDNLTSLPNRIAKSN